MNVNDGANKATTHRFFIKSFYFNRSIIQVQSKVLSNITNPPLLENTCKDDFFEDAGTFLKGDHLPLSNLQTEFEDVFAFSAKVLPLWEGVSRWMREARLPPESLLQSTVFEQWVFVLVQPPLVRSTVFELGSP